MTHEVVGLGRWGTWLADRLHALGETVLVRSTKPSKVEAFYTSHPTSYSNVPDLIWWCLPDDVVVDRLQASLPPQPVILASGAVALPAQQHKKVGVVWPIQSISEQVEPDWDHLPLVVQATDSALHKTLLGLARRISGLSPKPIHSNAERLTLHLGAVLTQNFSNLLWTLAESALSEHGLDYRLLLPLAETHLKTLAQRTPLALQTGPAARGDHSTMAVHEALLDADALRVYRLLSETIAQKKAQSNPSA